MPIAGGIIIDLSGDDAYRTESDFGLASGCFSVGLLLDFGGDDRYDAQSFALGSGFFGLGILYDAEGVDRYDGDTHVQGAASYGLGLLIDEGGRDIYNGALYAQGFGFVRGFGLIYDSDGSDSYYAGGKYKDILRYEDHYLSLSQGFGYGLRPWMSGGIGGIIDLKGNDAYYSDIFAQAASYWWSLGLIYDSSGNDNYQSFQYAQGAATHMTLGILIDDYGSDVYSGKGLMHGCGHDYAFGLLRDAEGNDRYACDDLSQGAGSANGIGFLLDATGQDGYLGKGRTAPAYGNPRRHFGSVGLLADGAGDDWVSRRSTPGEATGSLRGVFVDRDAPLSGPVWDPGEAVPYAPRDFAALEGGGHFPEIGEAGEVYLITNAPADQTADFGSWTIVRP